MADKKQGIIEKILKLLGRKESPKRLSELKENAHKNIAPKITSNSKDVMSNNTLLKKKAKAKNKKSKKGKGKKEAKKVRGTRKVARKSKPRKVVTLGNQKVEEQKSETPLAKSSSIKARTEIDTSFDKVLNYVNEKGKVSSKQIEKDLGLTQKEVIDCAKVLGEEGALTIEYPLFGGMNLEKNGYIKKK